MANIMRYDPLDELTKLQRDMSRLFDDAFRAPVRASDSNGGSANAVATRSWAPVVDVRDEPEEVVIHADIPGVKQEDIDIEMTGDTLVIRGERKFEETEQKASYVRVERSYGSFQRAFNIGVPIQTENVRAEFRDGVLTVHLPKSEAVKPKKISVAVNK